MTEVQAAEIDSYCQGNAFFQSAHDGLQGTPAKMGRMGVGGWERRQRYHTLAGAGNGKNFRSATGIGFRAPAISCPRNRLRRGTGEGVTLPLRGRYTKSWARTVMGRFWSAFSSAEATRTTGPFEKTAVGVCRPVECGV